VVQSPIYATGVGLALYGARGRRSGAGADDGEAVSGIGGLGTMRRLRDWFGELF
jgi:hypothetical protein